jgi:hypothetical protein
MIKHNTGTLVIRFVDGTKEVLEFALPPQDDMNLVARLQEILNAQHLMIEVEGKLIVYPFHSIKAIEVFPAPGKLPRMAIKKVHLTD